MTHEEARSRTTRARLTASTPEGPLDRLDRLATEEPLEIRVGGPGQEPAPVAVTMRTPGDDFELAAGFLATEGLVGHRDDVERLAYCLNGEGRQEYNVVTVRLRTPFDAEALRRNVYASSSCGICGKATLDQVEVHCAPLAPGPVVPRDVVLALPGRLREAQTVFESTGGLHAAGLFDVAGELLAVREDIGRHNAVDKLVGQALLAGKLPLAGRLLMVSGRAGFEIVQKAAVAGIPFLGAVSAPSSLAVEAAERLGLTLVGFLRGDRFNVYAHADRIALTV